jgi:hypothetical protein
MRKQLTLGSRSWTWLSAAMLLAAGAGAAFPGQSDAGGESKAPAAGVRAFVDPKTGQITANPSPEQLQRLAVRERSTLSRSVQGLRPFELQRGGRGLNLQGRFQTSLRVERAADGTFHVSCGDGETPHDASSHHHHDSSDAAGARTVENTPEQ